MESRRGYYVCVLFSIFYLSILQFTITDNQPRDNEMIFTKAECKNTADIFTELKCILIGREIKSISTNFSFAHYPMDMHVKVLADIRPLKNRPRMKVLQTDVNACDFLNGAIRGNIFSIMLKTLQKYMNAEIKCPFKTNFDYVITNFYFNASDFPAYFPLGPFRLFLDFYGNNKLLGYHHTWAKNVVKRKNSATPNEG